MNSNDLTRAQCRAIRAKFEPFRDYLYRLRVRMSKRGFPPDDPLYVLVLKAQQSVGELFVDIEFRTKCGPTDAPKPVPFDSLDKRTARKHERR